jgi:peroxiredoxin
MHGEPSLAGRESIPQERADRFSSCARSSHIIIFSLPAALVPGTSFVPKYVSIAISMFGKRQISLTLTINKEKI